MAPVAADSITAVWHSDAARGPSTPSLDHLIASWNGRLWNIRWPADDHPGFAPENLTTLPHFSVSSAMSLPKSATEPGSTMPPRSANRAFNLGSASPALIFAIELINDLGRRVFGGTEANPRARLETRHEIANGRDIWECL